MPSIVKRGDSYRIFVSLRSDGSGKPVRRSTTFHPPQGTPEKKARFLAESYAYQYEEQLRFFDQLDDGCKFSAFADWYFDTIAPNRLKERTLHNNRKLIDNYVIPRIGSFKLREITPCRIDELLSELRRSGSLKDQGPLSAGTVTLIRMAVSTLFSTAVKKGILSKNPVLASTPPRPEEKERSFLTDESSRILIEHIGEIHSEQVQRAIVILLHTGLRRGELLALHWKDVNFSKSELTVRYTLYRKKGRSELTSPKSRSSCRVLSLSPALHQLFLEQFACVGKMKKAAGRQWKDTDAVFVNRNGDYMNGEYLNNVFKDYLKKHDFPAMHIHDLRHANASILINRGVPMKIVSEHLGHTSEKTTEEYYTHMFSTSMKITADVMQEALAFPCNSTDRVVP